MNTNAEMSGNSLSLEIIELVPASVKNNISSFVFYDDHPQDDILIDIAICTNSGEVQEFYQRDLLNSLLLENTTGPYKIKIMRNKKAALFYLVRSSQELFIISRKESLQISRRVNNVEKYDIDDASCSGRISLKIFQRGEDSPLVLDEDLMEINKETVEEDETSTLILELQKKLSEAKYNLECNKKTYEELVNLRQIATYSVYQKIHGGFDATHVKHLKEVSEPKLKLKPPCVKYCNKKIVVLMNATNQYSETIKDVYIILRNNCSSLTYITKLYKKHTKSPYWIEKCTSNMIPYSEATIVAVFDMNELSNISFNKIEFAGIVTFKRQSKEFLVPFEQIVISSLDVMGENFDVLHSDLVDPSNILAALSSTVKTDLMLRRTETEIAQKKISMISIFSQYLNMETIPTLSNVVIHKNSPYHKLNGLIIVFNEHTPEDLKLGITVYSRTPSQVLDLIHYVYDAVPYKILMTTSNQKVTVKQNELSKHNDTNEKANLNSLEYASSILSRTGLILELLDRSIVKMNDNTDLKVRVKIGNKIDLSACETEYKIFEEKMIEFGAEGIRKMLRNDVSDDEVEEIVID